MVGLEGKAGRLPLSPRPVSSSASPWPPRSSTVPLVLLADEPARQPSTRKPARVVILPVLERINRTGTTVIMATHDYPLVDSMRRHQLNGGVVAQPVARCLRGRALDLRPLPRASTSSTAELHDTVARQARPLPGGHPAASQPDHNGCGP